MTAPGSVALVFLPSEMLGGCRVCVGVPQWLFDIDVSRMKSASLIGCRRLRSGSLFTWHPPEELLA